MRPDLAEVLDRLGAARQPRLLRVLKDAGLDAALPPPEPDRVEPYRWFLARVADGVKLTGAGYLPPAVVAETMHALGWDVGWFGSGNREDTTRPVADLRESARRLGLVRVHGGQLRPTTAGKRLIDDPASLWQHIAARLPLGRGEPERQAGFFWLLAVAAGRPRAEDVVAEGMTLLGWVDGHTGEPLDDLTAGLAVRDTRVVFDCLGLLGNRRTLTDEATPSAVALARAALLLEQPASAKRVPAVELTVTLRDVEPPVWRRIAVPERTTLRQLDGLLQAAMGWQGTHLSMFELDGRSYGEVEDMDELGNPSAVTVGSLAEGSAFRYDYDFGDGWEHDIRVEAHVAADAPRCLDGARACPPEDCGGPHGYARLLEALRDPAHPEHVDLADWLGGPFDPESFDVDAVDQRLRRAGRRRGATRPVG